MYCASGLVTNTRFLIAALLLAVLAGCATTPEPPPPEPAEPVAVSEPEPAAPEAASDRIVTEAEEVQTYAPASSMRPRSRPARPVRQAQPVHLANHGIARHTTQFLGDLAGRLTFRPHFLKRLYPFVRPRHGNLPFSASFYSSHSAPPYKAAPPALYLKDHRNVTGFPRIFLPMPKGCHHRALIKVNA